VIEYLDPMQLALLAGLTGDYVFVRSAGVGQLRKALERGGGGGYRMGGEGLRRAPVGLFAQRPLECWRPVF